MNKQGTQQPGRKACRNILQQGSCRFGDECRFSHDVASREDGDASHQRLSEGSVRQPCRNMLRHGSCRFGNRCRFSHSQSTQRPRRLQGRRNRRINGGSSNGVGIQSLAHMMSGLQVMSGLRAALQLEDTYQPEGLGLAEFAKLERRLFVESSNEKTGPSDCASGCGVDLLQVKNQIIVRLPCGHELFEDCARKWFLKNKVCPDKSCASEISASDLPDEQEPPTGLTFSNALLHCFRDAAASFILPANIKQDPLRAQVTFTSLSGAGDFDATYDGENVRAETVSQREMLAIGERSLSIVVRIFGRQPDQNSVLSDFYDDGKEWYNLPFKILYGIARTSQPELSLADQLSHRHVNYQTNSWRILKESEQIACQCAREPPEIRVLYR